MSVSSTEITQLLNAWVAGDADALNEVTPLLYDELHRIAERIFAGERGPQTLQPTALVHEAFERLIGVNATWQNRSHFSALAARMMRRLLVNNAKARRAKKRGGDAVRMTLNEEHVGSQEKDADVLALDAALSELTKQDPRKSQVLELHYFGGMTHEQTAVAMGISESTVRRELRVARLWLRKMLEA